MLLDKKYTSLIYYSSFILFLLAAIIFQKIYFALIPIAVLVIIIATYNLKWIWFVLLACIPLSFEFQVTESLGLDLPDESLQILITGLFALLLFTKKSLLPKAFLNHSIIILLVLIFIWSIISTAFSQQPILSFKYVLAKIWFIIPFTILPFLIIDSKKDLKQIAICLCIPIFFTVCTTMWQHYQQGFLFDNINNAVKPFYRNHVNYAALLVCGIAVVYCIFHLSSNQKIRNYLLATLFFMVIALFFTYSRGAWLALVVGIVAVLCIQKKIVAYSFLLSLVIGMGIIIWLAQDNRYINYHPNYRKTIYHANFNDHIDATFKGTDMSNAERFNRWIAGIKMVQENNLTGFGPNTFYHNYKPYMVTYFKTWVSDNKEKSTVHNYFLLTLIEQGWLGFLLLVIIVFYCLKKIERLYHILNDRFYKAIVMCIGVILCMIITLNMLSDLIETDKIGSLFYLCLGLIITIDLKHKNATLPII